MHQYIAYLGNNPAISTAELSAVLPDFLKQPDIAPGILSFSTKEELDQKFLNKLGGTILIARVISGTSVFALNDVPTVLATECAGMKGKLCFALRFVGVGPNQAKELYRKCKDMLKSKGNSSRYIGNERDAAKPIQLHDEGMIEGKKACELVILQTKTSLILARTIAAQNVKAYTLRDIEKPVRDTTVGLLPPKLAQIMLNFGAYVSNVKPGKQATVFDPFCGTGVIPLEAMLRGDNVLASDVSLKAVNGCEKNLEWGRKIYKIAKKDVTDSVWKQDAIKPFELKEKPTMIVTEGTLGPNLKDRATVKDADKFARDLGQLIKEFLQNCAKTLPGTPVVMTLPVWYAQKKQLWLEKFFEHCTDAGFTPVLPPHVSPTTDERFSLLYRRPDQFVGREIVILKPKA